MTVANMTLIPNLTINKVKFKSQLSHKENTSDGVDVPVYNSTSHSNKIKQRKYNKIISEYGKAKNLFSLFFDKNNKFDFKNLDEGKTSEEQLAFQINKLIEVTDIRGNITPCIVPKRNNIIFKGTTYKLLKQVEQKYYKCISDTNGVIALRLCYDKGEKNNKIIKNKILNRMNSFNESRNGNINNNNIVRANSMDRSRKPKRDSIMFFSFFYLDQNSMKLIFHERKISFRWSENLAFKMILKNSSLYIVWYEDNRISKFDFGKVGVTYNEIFTGSRIGYESSFAINNEYIAVIERDESFFDSVFSVDGLSKRKTSFYNMKTGSCDFKSTSILSKISELIYLDHPTDVIFIHWINQPMWIVTEWLLPDMTLSKLIFYWQTKTPGKQMKVLNLQKIFTDYKRFFTAPNESQLHGFEICPLTNQLFVWSSKRHILVIDLIEIKVDYILQLKADRFSDYQNELYYYNLDVSRSGREVQVVITKGSEYVHYETFQLQPRLSLKTQSSIAVIENYDKKEIEKSMLPKEVSEELLSYI